MDEMLARAWDQLWGRLSGPMAFRFVMQPTMAAIVAVRAGLADARSGRPAYLWKVITSPADRWPLIRRGWQDVAMVFAVACVLDTAYQIYMFRFLYPLQTLVVAGLLAVVPYVVIRGPVNRLARLRVMTRVNGAIARRASGWAIAWAILLIAVGIGVMLAPMVTSVYAVFVIGWFVIVGGITHVLSAFAAPGLRSGAWKALVGVAYLLIGTAMWLHPLWGLATVALVISATFLAEGVLALAAYVAGGIPDRSGWTMFNGIVALLLAVTIWSGRPASSLWVLGMLVGVNIFAAGISRLALSLAARHMEQTIPV